MQPHNLWIGAADLDGVVRAATGNLLRGQSVLQRPWFSAGLHGLHVGDVHPAKMLASLLAPNAAGEPQRFVDFSAPILSGDKTIGVLGKPCITQHHLCLLHPFFHLVNFPSLRAQVFARRQAFEAFFGTCNRFLGALMQSGPTALATTSAAPSTNCPAQTRCATAARSSSDPGSAL